MTTPLEVDGPRPGVAWASTVEVDHPDDRVLLVMLALDSWDGHTCQPVVRDLLVWCGWSSNRDRLYRARQRLTDRRLLTWVESKGRKPTRYHLLRPMPAEPSGDPGQLDAKTANSQPSGDPGRLNAQPSGEPSGQPSGEPSGDPGHALALALAKNSSSTAAMLPGVLAGVRSADDDETRESLHGIPGVRPNATVRELVGEYLANGWTAVQVNALLRLGMSGNPANPMGCLTKILRDHREESAPRATVSPWDESTWCGECDRHGRWVEDESGVTRKCPTCHPGMIGKPRPNPVRDETRSDEPVPIRSAAPAAMSRITSGDKRRMMGGRR